MKLDVRTFVARCGHLPSLPAICQELTKAIQDPDAPISAISAIISKDLSLAANVLKLANSVVFGAPSQVATLEYAVQIIGLHQIRDLVLATSVFEGFDHALGSVVDVPSFWKHSIACGLASVLLANERNQPEAERLFVGGLLHDIGRLVMFLGAPEESGRIVARCQAEGKGCCVVETEVLGFDHAMLGAELICSWNLPRPLVQMVRWHHNPPKSATGLTDTFLIHYADFLVRSPEFGTSGELGASPLIVPPTLRGFLLEPDRVEVLLTQLRNQCAQLFPILTTKADPAPSQAEVTAVGAV